MNYFELQIKTRGVGVEFVENKLTELGITQFVIDDPNLDAQMIGEACGTEYVDRAEILERSNRDASVTVYTETLESAKNLEAELNSWTKELLSQIATGTYGNLLREDAVGDMGITLRMRSDEEWKDKWKAYFKPTAITDRIVVCPSWESYDKKKDSEIVISIDPGMAFGTGTHETTSLTVMLMEKYLTPEDSLLDVGCGSGILSIIAAKLGAGRILGIDIDEEAIAASRENATKNDLGENLTFQIGDLTKGVDFKADVVVANLLTNLVLQLSPDIPSHLIQGGYYITSGILIEQKFSVMEALEELGFTVLETAEKGEWCCIAATR